MSAIKTGAGASLGLHHHPLDLLKLTRFHPILVENVDPSVELVDEELPAVTPEEEIDLADEASEDNQLEEIDHTEEVSTVEADQCCLSADCKACLKQEEAADDDKEEEDLAGRVDEVKIDVE